MKFLSNILRLGFICLGITFNYVAFDMIRVIETDAGNRPVIATLYAVACIGYVLFMLSPVGDKWLNLTIGARPLTSTEKPRIAALDTELSERAAQAGLPYPAKLEFRVLTDAFPSAMAFGRRSINFTSGLLKSMDDDEVAAVLAHEAGHIVHKDTFGDLLIYLAFGPLLMIGRTAIAFATGIMTNIPGAILGMLILLLLCVPVLSVVMILLYQFLSSFLSRSKEYAADEYAACLTGHDGLAGFLEQIEFLDTVPEGKFLAAYMQSHPPTALRVDRLKQIAADLC